MPPPMVCPWLLWHFDIMLLQSDAQKRRFDNLEIDTRFSKFNTKTLVLLHVIPRYSAKNHSFWFVYIFNDLFDLLGFFIPGLKPFSPLFYFNPWVISDSCHPWPPTCRGKDLGRQTTLFSEQFEDIKKTPGTMNRRIDLSKKLSVSPLYVLLAEIISFEP